MRRVPLSLRAVSRAWRYSALASITLALAMASTAVMVGVIDQLFFSDPPLVHDVGRVTRLYLKQQIVGGGESVGRTFSYPTFQALRENEKWFSDVAGFTSQAASVGQGLAARQVEASYVTPQFFPLLGIHPVLGRAFAGEDDEPPYGRDVVVLGYEYWKAQFGGDPAILGQRLRIGVRDCDIIGVAPPGFLGVDETRADVWLPLASYGRSRYGDSWAFDAGSYWINIIARLSPGTTQSEASAAATISLQRHLHLTQGDSNRPRIIAAPLMAARGPNRPLEARVSMWLTGVAAIVLLVACANVANLALARTIDRSEEIAVRTAMGATRADLIGHLLLESTWVSMAGGGLGLVLAYAGGGALRAALLGRYAGPGASIDGHVLVFVALAVTATALITGLMPAVAGAQPDLRRFLHGSARTSGLSSRRICSALLVGQVTLTVVLLCGAGLFVHSLDRLSHMDIGFDPDQVLVVKVDLASLGYGAQQAETFYARTGERLLASPNVEHVSVAANLPFLSGAVVRVEGQNTDSLPGLPTGLADINAVGRDFVETMGMRVIRGNDFQSEPEGGPVVIVNQVMASAVWPRQNVLGKCIRVGGSAAPCSRIVGVVADTKRDQLREMPTSQLLVPLRYAPRFLQQRNLLVRVRGDPERMIPFVRRALQEQAPNVPLPFPDVRTLSSTIATKMRPWRLGATLFSVFGLLALTIAAVGLFGLFYNHVQDRRRELGIRMALGGSRRAVVELIMAQSLPILLVGGVLGLLVASVAATFLTPLLFETAAVSPGIDALVLGIVLLSSILAAVWPALSAARIDPAEVLRSE